MKHAQYQVEVWKQGALVIRSEVSDSVEMTVNKARTLYTALGITFTVFVVRDSMQFAEYEWAQLLENHPEIVRDWVEARDLKTGDDVIVNGALCRISRTIVKENTVLISMNQGAFFEESPDAPYTLAK